MNLNPNSGPNPDEDQMPWLEVPERPGYPDREFRSEVIKDLSNLRRVSTNRLNQQQGHQKSILGRFADVDRALERCGDLLGGFISYCQDAFKTIINYLFHISEDQEEIKQDVAETKQDVAEIKELLAQLRPTDQDCVLLIPREESHFTEEVDEG